MDAQTARGLWIDTEPFHSMVYFASEQKALYGALGLQGPQGYFCSRSAAMGAVAGPVVAACFYGFNPVVVSAQVAAGWSVTTPDQVIATRLQVADQALRRMAGDLLDRPDIAEAATIAEAAAASADTAGRPLAAAWQAVVPPQQPHLRLWLAMAVLREHRGDGHVATLVSESIAPVEAHHLVVAQGRADSEALRARRAWSEEAWEDGRQSLVVRGLLADNGMLTPAGEGLVSRMELTTNELAARAWEPVGTEGAARLVAVLEPVVDAIVAADGLPYPNPAGLPPRKER